ncbi:unnamed protein product [Orchesella dallaii]|uniref:Uncharacterized protein n=1 Tax=Orchesella dallaii TaxID=48710 RepID=A0ABP1Q652_9HEXA
MDHSTTHNFVGRNIVLKTQLYVMNILEKVNVFNGALKVKGKGSGRREEVLRGKSFETKALNEPEKPTLNWVLAGGEEEVLAWDHVNFKIVLRAIAEVILVGAPDVDLEPDGPTYQENEQNIAAGKNCLESIQLVVFSHKLL